MLAEWIMRKVKPVKKKEQETFLNRLKNQDMISHQKQHKEEINFQNLGALGLLQLEN